jgi:hypothetical protein
LLVLASCLPVLWLLAMIVPGPPLAAQYLPFVYYLPGLLIGCLIMRHLIGRKQEIVVRP